MASFLLASAVAYGLYKSSGVTTRPGNATKTLGNMPGELSDKYRRQSAYPFRAPAIRQIDPLFTSGTPMTVDARTAIDNAGSRSMVTNRLDALRTEFNRNPELDLANARRVPGARSNILWWDRHFLDPSHKCPQPTHAYRGRPLGGQEREWRSKLGLGV